MAHHINPRGSRQLTLRRRANGTQEMFKSTALHARLDQRPRCPCLRGPALHDIPDSLSNLPYAMHEPFPGHHNLVGSFRGSPDRPLQSTQQCIFCCGYVVPPKRKSDRVRNGRLEQHDMQVHQMLDDRGRPVAIQARQAGPLQVR